MHSLKQAIENISQCTAPSTKFARPIYKIENKTLFAYNGTLGASTPFEAQFPNETIAVDAEALTRIWQDGARATIENDQLVIRTRRTKYQLPLQDPEIFECPPLVPGGAPLTTATLDAVRLAAKFASENAVNPWACAVHLHKGRAIATNNLTVVSVECDMELSGTLPFWAVQSLRTDGITPLIRIDARGVSLTYADGTIIQSTPLAAAMPEKLLDIANSIDDADVPVATLCEAAEDIYRSRGRRITLDAAARRVVSVSDTGVRSETEVDLGDTDREPGTIQEPILKLILENASHIGFALAPGKILFSSDKNPKFKGLAACMVG